MSKLSTDFYFNYLSKNMEKVLQKLYNVYKYIMGVIHMGANKRKPEVKKISINKNIKIFCISISVILLIVMSAMLATTIIKGKFVEKKVPVYSYNHRAKVNYQVFLLPNNLYPADQKSIGEGNIYIKKLLDYIDTNFKYEFNGQSNAEIQGKYSIKAVVEGQLGNDKGKKSIWKYEEQLLPEQSFKVDNSKHTLEAKTQIKPQHFEDIARKKSQDNDIGFETKLTIYWNIQIEAKTDKGIIKEQLEPTMEIPINSEKYFEIKGNLTPEKKGAIEATTKVVSPTYKKKVDLYTVVIGVCLLALLFILLGTASKPSDNPLQKKLKNIFKNHGDRLVRLTNENLIGFVQLVHVKEFDDLVRIADDIGRPIFYKHYEDINDISTFYVFDDKYVYIFQLKEAGQAAITMDKECEASRNSGMFVRY